MRLCSVCIAVAMALSTAVSAAESLDAAAHFGVIGPFVDEQTAGVVHVDLARLQNDPFFDQLEQLVSLITKIRTKVPPACQALVQAGVKDCYWPFTVGGWFVQPCQYVLIPLPPGSDEKAVRDALTPGTAPTLGQSPNRAREGTATERVGDVLVAGDHREVQTLLARLHERGPELRPELAAAFEAAGNTAAQVIFLPPRHFRRVIEETMPELPKELGGGSSKVVTQGVLWAVAGIDLPPRAAVHVIVQSQDAPAAESLRVKLIQLMQAVVQLKEVGPYVPKPEDAVALLTPNVEGDRLLLTLDETNQEILKAQTVLRPLVDILRARVARRDSIDNLKNLAIAMHNYHDTHKSFPLPGSLGPDKKPLLSWRVQLLPFLEGGELYRQFHLDEPWDSPHNRTLVEKMPPVFRLGVSKREAGWTNYVVPVGNGAGFAADRPTAIRDITDGTSNTVMILEVDDDHAVIWTKPEDLSFDPKDPAKGVGRFFAGGFQTAFFDGSVRHIPPAIAPDTLRLLITRADGRTIPGY